MTTISKKAVLKALQAAIDRAKSTSATSSYAQGKVFELKVLAQLLFMLRSQGYTLTCTPKVKHHLTFGGGPCKPNGAGHDCIRVHRGTETYEFWVSVQFTTLSHELGAKGMAPAHSDLHEIDIGLFQPLTGPAYPSFRQVVFAASCKAGVWSKLFAREALGLRRELGVLTAPHPSTAAWFEAVVPASPAIPLALFSADPNCTLYQGSLAALGLYVHYFE